MIYLVSGRNGSGKTQLLFRTLLSDDRFKGRPLIIRGIPLARRAFQAFRILAVDPDWIAHWWELCRRDDADDADDRELEPGSVFVLDEAWDLLGGARGAQGREAHPWIAPLRTHRHFGFDFIFIGQNIKDFPPVLRSLAAQHWHVLRRQGVMKVLVWDSRCGDPDNTLDVAAAEALPWKVPTEDSEAWGMYHSADLHTAQPGKGAKFLALRRRVGLVAAAIVLALCVGLYGLYDLFSGDGMLGGGVGARMAGVDASGSDLPPPGADLLPPAPEGFRRVDPAALGVSPDGAIVPALGLEWSVPARVRANPGGGCRFLLATRSSGSWFDPPPRDPPGFGLLPIDAAFEWRDPAACKGDSWPDDNPDMWTCYPPESSNRRPFLFIPVIWSWVDGDCSVAAHYWRDRTPAPLEPNRRLRDMQASRRGDSPADAHRRGVNAFFSSSPITSLPRSSVRIEGDGMDPALIDDRGRVSPDGIPRTIDTPP